MWIDAPEDGRTSQTIPVSPFRQADFGKSDLGTVFGKSDYLIRQFTVSGTAIPIPGSFSGKPGWPLLPASDIKRDPRADILTRGSDAGKPAEKTTASRRCQNRTIVTPSAPKPFEA